MSITYSLNICDSLNWMIRMLCALGWWYNILFYFFYYSFTIFFSFFLETNSVSIERILEYSNNKPEKPWTRPDTDDNLSSDWPDNGHVTFEDYGV